MVEVMVAVGAVIEDGRGRVLLVSMSRKGAVSGRGSGFVLAESWSWVKRLKKEL